LTNYTLVGHGLFPSTTHLLVIRGECCGIEYATATNKVGDFVVRTNLLGWTFIKEYQIRELPLSIHPTSLSGPSALALANVAAR
jgi:hypothetical protein